MDLNFWSTHVKTGGKNFVQEKEKNLKLKLGNYCSYQFYLIQLYFYKMIMYIYIYIYIYIYKYKN